MRARSTAGGFAAGAAVLGLFVACGLPEVPAVGSMPDGDSDGAAHLAGCAVEGGAPKTAPGGYYTNGASVCTAAGAAHLFHGVDRPSLEWSPTGDHLSAADFALMGAGGWNANVVRIATNQDFWLAGAAQYSPGYAALLAEVVQWAEAAGLDVILDLHWSDKGDLSVTTSAQQEMADANSKQFWSEVASAFKGDGHVFFELYNEPHGVTWDVWQNGGQADGFTAVGMQELYDAVRATGADNLVLIGGLDWAYNLEGVATNAVQGYNIVYATHPYDESDKQPSGWQGAFGYLATGDVAPVIATEFGDGTSDCTGAWDSSLIAFAAARQISWSAWGWYPGGCSFPSLISDWTPTATVQGQVVQAALATQPKATPWTDASLEASEDAGDDGALEAAVDVGGDRAIEAGDDADAP